jgi:hypothetical protein
MESGILKIRRLSIHVVPGMSIRQNNCGKDNATRTHDIGLAAKKTFKSAVLTKLTYWAANDVEVRKQCQ